MKINIEMSPKEKKIGLGILIGLAAVILLVGVVLGAISISKKSKKTDDSKKADNETTQTETVSTESGSKENQSTGKEPAVTYTLTKGSSWESSDKKYQQYTLTISNNESSTLKAWVYSIELSDGGEITQSWNCNLTSKDGKYIITPVEYNKEIQSGKSVTDIGLTICSTSFDSIKTAKLDVDLENGTNVAATETSAETPTNSTTAATEAQTNVASNNTNPTGGLRVSGTKLVDTSGNAVQLRGVSTHGIQWGEMKPYVNQQAVQTLHDDWNANVFRIAMYVEEGGYMSGGNQTELKKLIDDGVKYATDLGMYSIIDWHVLNYSPDRYTEQAKAFFAEMAQKYADNDHVIYEICNEPVGSNWNNNIKPYAEAVIASIRQYDSDAVILVGTNTWSQDVDDVIGNRIDDANTMYVLHFYAATHKDNIRNKLQKALDAGIPIFVSECSICDASGNGGIDYDSANTWLNYLNQNDISFVAWSLCNKAESSALIKNSCSKLYGWTDDDLSDTGKWFKKAISGK